MTEQKQHPVLFRPEMVRAILGRPGCPKGREDKRTGGADAARFGEGARLGSGLKRMTRRWPDSPLARARPGDVIWVKEGFAFDIDFDDLKPLDVMAWHAERDIVPSIWYRADGEDELFKGPFRRGRWRSPLHLPRACARLRLRVTAVRTEPLGAISSLDCLHEGMSTIHSRGGIAAHCMDDSWPPALIDCNPVTAFRKYWESLHGPGGGAGVRRQGSDSWIPDQPVAVISFERIEP